MLNRLDLHVEATRRLEQPDHHLREGDLRQRLVEDRLADGAHRGFEFVDARFRWYPAGVDVQFGDAMVVAIEERKEVAGEVLLVGRA